MNANTSKATPGTLTELLTAYPTFFTLQRIEMRTDATSSDAWSKTARHWIVTLTAHDAAGETDASGFTPYSMPPRGAIAVEFSQGSAHKKPPTARDVVASLFTDVSWARDYTMDEMAAECGITVPSKAFAMWNACREAERKLAVLYGSHIAASGIDTEGD